jgi:retinol dehydrogenase-12
MNCKTIFSLVVLVISVFFGIIVYRFRSYTGPSGYGFTTTAEEVAKATDLTGKVAIVTGANAGIGIETARVLALQGAHVFVLARSLSKSQQAVDEILANLPPSPPKPYKVTPLPCDLASLDSIRKAVEEFKSFSIPLHFLVNNAATIPNERTLTEDGFETQMGVNHLGHFYLVNLLMDKLIESQPSRVVIVSSDAHKESKIEFLNDTELGMKEYSSFQVYATTKLANVLHARELNERFASKGVTAYSLHPGIIFTNIGNSSKFVYYFQIIATPVSKSVPQGAATTLYATLKATQGGKYFADCNLVELNEFYEKLVGNPEVRKNFWEKSEKLIQEKLEKKTVSQ